MKYIHLIIALSLLGLSQAYAQQRVPEEQRILFSGVVMNEAGEPLEDVHIINQYTRQVTVTDPSGFFTIYIRKHHTLHFTSVGYDTYVFVVQRDYQGDMLYEEITLQPKTYALREVTVQEEKEVIETVVRKPELEPLGDFGTLRGRKPVPVAPTLQNPISYIYEMFGNTPKQRRKLQQLLREQRLDSIAYARLSSDQIWQVTGLYGDRLIAFKEHINLPPEFYLYASDYEFLITIRQLYARYQRRPVE